MLQRSLSGAAVPGAKPNLHPSPGLRIAQRVREQVVDHAAEAFRIDVGPDAPLETAAKRHPGPGEKRFRGIQDRIQKGGQVRVPKADGQGLFLEPRQRFHLSDQIAQTLDLRRAERKPLRL